MMRTIVAVVVLCGAVAAGAQDRVALDEVLGSWQGDDEVQFVELRMLANGQHGLALAAQLVFDDATGSADGRRFFVFPQNVARGLTDAKVLVATTKLRDLAGVQPDFTLPPGLLRPRAGRVCYQVGGAFGVVTVDCVAYGAFTGGTGTYGAPTRVTPDNRSLTRVQLTGRNRADWQSVLEPRPENNAGQIGGGLVTLCGSGRIEQGEECDGDVLAGETCASLGFAKGKLRCTQCHFDTTKCTTCGNDAITGKEECDGTDLGDRTCASIGFTGGTLACTEDCTLTTEGCDATFFVPGGGGKKSDCYAEWRIMNAAGRPGGDGKARPRQRCQDGDPGCDADGVRDGVCTFSVAACLSRADARLDRCPLTAVASWTLLGKLDPADPVVAALLSSVAALGPSTTDGLAVTFAPPLAVADACGADVAIPVAARSRVAVRMRAVPAPGKPRDTDKLRLVCKP